MREAGAPSTGECALAECARPTRGTHDLTTEAFTLLMSIGISLEIPKGPVPLRSDVRCTRYVCRHPAPLTRTRAPATAIVQRHPVGREEGAVGRASRARLSTPRQPTPHRRVLYASWAGLGRRGLRASGRGKAKGRSQVDQRAPTL